MCAPAPCAGLHDALRAELATYRANVSTAMVARGAEEVYCVQYAVTPPELAPTDILGALGEEGSGLHPHTSATLSVRYVGKPTYDFGARTSVRGFQYSAALPSFLSRMVGQARILMGDETVDEVEEEAAADMVAAGAAAKVRGRSRVPYLVRNAVRNGAAGAGPGSAEAGSSTAAASRWGTYADLEGAGLVVSGNLAASVGEAGVLRYTGGTEETLVRGTAGGGAAGAAGGEALEADGDQVMAGEGGGVEGETAEAHDARA